MHSHGRGHPVGGIRWQSPRCPRTVHTTARNVENHWRLVIASDRWPAMVIGRTPSPTNDSLRRAIGSYKEEVGGSSPSAPTAGTPYGVGGFGLSRGQPSSATSPNPRRIRTAASRRYSINTPWGGVEKADCHEYDRGSVLVRLFDRPEARSSRGGLWLGRRGRGRLSCRRERLCRCVRRCGGGVISAGGDNQQERESEAVRPS